MAAHVSGGWGTVTSGSSSTIYTSPSNGVSFYLTLTSGEGLGIGHYDSTQSTLKDSVSLVSTGQQHKFSMSNGDVLVAQSIDVGSRWIQHEIY